MRKNRNAFFESNNSMTSYNPMGNMPFVGAQSSFYGGPNPNMMMPGNNMPGGNYDDIMERLAKIERNYSRLDHRVSKLENSSIKTTEDFESTTNNMYII